MAHFDPKRATVEEVLEMSRLTGDLIKSSEIAENPADEVRSALRGVDRRLGDAFTKADWAKFFTVLRDAARRSPDAFRGLAHKLWSALPDHEREVFGNRYPHRSTLDEVKRNRESVAELRRELQDLQVSAERVGNGPEASSQEQQQFRDAEVQEAIWRRGVGTFLGVVVVSCAIALGLYAVWALSSVKPPAGGAGYIDLWIYIATLVAKAASVGAGVAVIVVFAGIAERLLLPIGVVVKSDAMAATGRGRSRRLERFMLKALKVVVEKAGGSEAGDLLKLLSADRDD